MLAPEDGRKSVTSDSHGTEMSKNVDIDECEKIEKLKKIQDLALRATKTRKISLDMNKGVTRKASHQWTVGMTKIRAKHAFEDGIHGYHKGRLEKDIMAFDKTSQNKHEGLELKLPSIVVKDRCRSSTIGCVDELKPKFEVRKKTSLDSSVRDLKNESICEDELDEKEVRFQDQPIECNTGDGNEHRRTRSMVERGMQPEFELSSEISPANGVYRLCGHASHTRSLSRQVYTGKQHAHTSELIDNERANEVPKQAPISNHYASKVDGFLKANQPGPAPKSLKISQSNLNELAKSRRHNLTTTSKSKSSTCSDVLLNASLYMNPFMRADGKPWYYASKEGRCRYLRAPMTPVLTVEEIFQSPD